MTTVCPGPVRTDISRNLAANSIVARVLVPLFFIASAKSPDYGARLYVNASVAKPEDHVGHPAPSSRLLPLLGDLYVCYHMDANNNLTFTNRANFSGII